MRLLWGLVSRQYVIPTWRYVQTGEHMKQCWKEQGQPTLDAFLTTSVSAEPSKPCDSTESTTAGETSANQGFLAPCVDTVESPCPDGYSSNMNLGKLPRTMFVKSSSNRKLWLTKKKLRSSKNAGDQAMLLLDQDSNLTAESFTVKKQFHSKSDGLTNADGWCLPCLLFLNNQEKIQLVKTPFRNYNKSKEVLDAHEECKYHKKCMERDGYISGPKWQMSRSALTHRLTQWATKTSRTIKKSCHT